jgi:GxxExxY protein
MFKTQSSSTVPLKYEALTEKIIGAFFDVYNKLGPGFLESVYQRAMVVALLERGLTATVESQIEVWFHGQQVGDFRADLVAEDIILLELKAVRMIDSSHESQILHYLRATNFEVGLLLNFGSKAEFRRFILDNSDKKSAESVKSAVSGSQ